MGLFFGGGGDYTRIFIENKHFSRFSTIFNPQTVTNKKPKENFRVTYGTVENLRSYEPYLNSTQKFPVDP